jgi:hypothetical protein
MLHRFDDGPIANGLNRSTLEGTLMPLRVTYRRAIQHGIMATNPGIGPQLPAVQGRRERTASPDEADRLVAARPGQSRAIYATAVSTGLRAGNPKP